MKYYDIRKNLKIKKEKSDTNFKDVSKICTKAEKKKEIKDKSNTETRKEKFRMAFQFLFRFLNTEGRARRAPLVSLWFEET